MLGRIIANDLSPPELRRLSPDAYERLHWQAKLRRGDAAWVVPMVVGIGAGLVWLLAAGVMRGLVTTAASNVSINLAQPMANPSAWWALNVVVAGLVMLAFSMFARHAMIMRSIRLLLNRAGCPYCDFSLYGLRVSPGNSVICPECGTEVFLHEHRMHRDDIEPSKAFSGAGPRGAYQDVPGEEPRRGRRGSRSRERVSS